QNLKVCCEQTRPFGKNEVLLSPSGQNLSVAEPGALRKGGKIRPGYPFRRILHTGLAHPALLRENTRWRRLSFKLPPRRLRIRNRPCSDRKRWGWASKAKVAKNWRRQQTCWILCGKNCWSGKRVCSD